MALLARDREARISLLELAPQHRLGHAHTPEPELEIGFHRQIRKEARPLRQIGDAGAEHSNTLNVYKKKKKKKKKNDCCAHRHARLCEHRRHGSWGVAGHGFQRSAALVRQLCQSKVEDLGLPARGGEIVRRLQIAVHDAFGVGHVERVGNLDADIENFVERQRMAIDAIVEALPLQQFDGDEALAFALLNRVDGAYVGMVER